MAKYTVSHSCGHTQVHDLYGPGDERKRKIAWLETTLCKECWMAEQRKASKSVPITAEVIYNAFTHGGCYLAVTGGDTYAIKDALKAAGCRWMEYRDNNDILGLKPPRKAWMIQIDPDNETETAAVIQKLFDAGVTAVRDTTNPISAALAIRLATNSGDE